MLEIITFGSDPDLFLQSIIMIGLNGFSFSRIAIFTFSISLLFFVAGIIKKIIEDTALTSLVMSESLLPQHASDQSDLGTNTSCDVLFHEIGHGFLNFFLLICATDLNILSSMLHVDVYDVVWWKCKEHNIKIFFRQYNLYLNSRYRLQQPPALQIQNDVWSSTYKIYALTHLKPQQP